MIFPSELTVGSKEQILEAIGHVGETVRRRTGPDRRTADDRDWWCFRRWLLTLGTNDLLFYPFVVTRPTEAGPDFLLTYPTLRGASGLEVTEATNPEDSREMTLSDRHGKGQYSEGDFGGRRYTATSEEDLRGDYVAQILEGLDRKLSKAGEYFLKCHSLDLLIYVNNNAGTYVTLQSVAQNLNDEIFERIQESGELRRFGRVTVLDHLETLVCFDGACRMFRTVDGLAN